MSTDAPRLLAISGSMRRESFNTKLLNLAVGIAEGLGASVDRLTLRELNLPLYDGDLEEASGLPPGAVALKARIAEADGLLIASPEYNHSVSGVLKNAIDWASRGEDRVFRGKTAAIMSASIGPSGGFRSLPHLRQTLSVLGVWLVPAQVAVAHARGAFDESAQLKDDALRGQLESLVDALVSHTRSRSG